MELASSTPHVSNASQQSTTRNPNPEAIPPNVRTLNPGDMRQKVVEILSGTANGCLQELGYFPGMPIKLQELEARNKNWQKENLKLYEDNKRLVQTLKSQAESLKLLQAPDSEKLNYINSLEMENRSLKVQLEQLQSKPSSESFQTAVNDQKYTALHRDYTALAETYNLAYQEIVRLREIVRTGQNTYQPHHKQDQNSLHNPQQQKPNASTARRNPPPQIPQIQTQIGFGMGGPVKGQHHFVSSPAAISPVNQYALAQNQHQQQAQYNENLAGQSSHNLYRQHPAPPNQIHRRMSGNVMTGPGNSSMQAHQQMVAQNQLISSVVPIVPSMGQLQASSSKQEYFQAHPGPNAGTAQNTQSLRRASAPVFQMDRHVMGQNPYDQSFYPPSQPHDGQTTMRTGSVPLPNQTFQANLPPPPASAPPNGMSLNTNSTFFASSMSNSRVQVPPPDLPQSSQNYSLPTTVSPNDTYISHPEKSPLPAPIPIIPANVHVNIPYPAPFPSSSSSPKPSVGQIMQRHDSARSSSPMYPGHSGFGTMTPSSSSASPHLRISHLKRETMSAELDAQLAEPNKKPRLHSSDMELSTPLSPSATPSAISTPSVLEVPAVSLIQSMANSSEQTVDEEEEEEIVEIGPDGLRLVEDILEQVYGENRRREVVCWFCKNRFEKGFTDAPPKAFIGVTDQELEAHCVENHEIAWNQARASI